MPDNDDIALSLTKRELIAEYMEHYDDLDLFMIYHINTEEYLTLSGTDMFDKKKVISIVSTLEARNVDVFGFKDDGTVDTLHPVISGAELHREYCGIVKPNTFDLDSFFND